MKRHLGIAVLCACIFPLYSNGRSYPVKTVRIVVPYAAGGNTDFTARAIAERLTPVFKQQVIVENRPGGATNIGTELSRKRPPTDTRC